MSASQMVGAESEQGISFWQLCRNRKWLILFCASVGLGIGYYYFNRQPPVYESAARIYVYVEKAHLPLESARISTHRQDLQRTHLQIIQSPMVVGYAVSNSGLSDLPSLKGTSDPVAAIIGNLRADGIEDTDILQLTYRSRYPDDCRQILEAVSASYQHFLEASQKEEKSEINDVIKEAMLTLNSDIEKHTKEMTQKRIQNRLVFKGDVAYNPHQANMERIDERKKLLEIEKLEIEGRITAIRKLEAQGENRGVLLQMMERFEAEGEPTPELGIPKTETDYKSLSLVQMKIELARMLRTLGMNHDKVLDLKAAIQAYEDFYETESASRNPEDGPAQKPSDFVNRYLTALEHQVRTIEAMIGKLAEEYVTEQSASYKIDELIDQDNSLRYQIAASQNLVDILSKKLSELSLIGDKGGLRSQIIAAPGTGSQVAVNFNQIMTLAGGVGLMAGLLLGYLFEMSDTSFRSPDDIVKQLGVPVLGHIPAMNLSQVVVDPKVGFDPALCTFYDPKSRTAEAYRAIRTALYFSTRGEGHKLIQVTSPDPSEGKSTLAANLAVSIANSGKRVLLIDADFRRPRVHRIFRLRDEVGVTSIIAGMAEIPDAIQETRIENLSALPCGPRPPNPSEMLTSPRFKELLDVLRDQFDFVIVDTPPMLAVTDPSAVAPRVDGVFLALRLTSKARQKATQAVQMLASFNANVLGVVVNGVGSRNDHAYGTDYAYSGKRPHYGNYNQLDSDEDGYWTYYDEDTSGGVPVGTTHSKSTADGPHIRM